MPSLVGALFVTVSGTGTIAAMLTAPWLRDWLYGAHPLSGVAGLRAVFQGDQAALVYSHQITAAVDAPTYLIIAMAFPLIALVMGVLTLWGYDAAGSSEPPPPRHGGGPPGPDAVPDPPGGGQLVGSYQY